MVRTLFFLSFLFFYPCNDLSQEINSIRLKMKLRRVQKLNPAPTLPMELFFKNPLSSAWQLSPDGKFLAFLKPWNQRMNLFLLPFDSINFQTSLVPLETAKQLTKIESRDIAAWFWKGNETIVYLRDFGGDENFHLFAVNIHTGEEKDLTPHENIQARVVDDLEDHPDLILVGINKENPRVHDVWQVNVKTAESKMVAKNPGNVTGWITDHNGVIRLAHVTDGINSTWLHRKDENSPFETMITTDFRQSLSPLFFTFDNKNLYASSNLSRDKSAIVEFSIPEKKETKILFSHPDVDTSILTWSRKLKKLIGVIYETDKRKRIFFDADWKEMFAFLESRLQGNEITISSLSKDENRMIISTYTDRNPGEVWLYDVSSKNILRLAQKAPWIQPSQMAPMISFEYQSRDGLTIPAYLTIPNGKKAKNLPAVIMPHGGPWARDRWGYSPVVQFLANRGYAVLQMNFRGSTGYGRKSWESSFKQWGLSMQDDITDGVEFLKKAGIIHPRKIAIHGASYGGYATLAGLAFTPDLYCCGVDYVGVSNIFTLLESIPPYWKPMLEMMYEMVGHPKKDKELLKQVSPVFHAKKIKVPLMIAQGAKDPRVKKAESDQMVKALRERGVEVPYLVKENEGHGFHNEENRMEFYREMEAFLHKHLLEN